MEEVVGSTPISSTISLYRLCLFALTALFFTPPAVVAAQTSGGKASRIPDVEIIVISTPALGDSVSITYPSLVRESEARGDLEALRRASGWTIANVKISSSSVLKSGADPMTSAEFSTEGLVDRAAGAFRLEPIIKALKRKALIEIVYVVQPPFEFRGIRTFQNRNVKVSLEESRDATYRYRIRVLDPRFVQLDLPQTEPVKPSAPAETPSSNLNWLRIAVALAAGAMAALLIALAIIRRRQG